MVRRWVNVSSTEVWKIALKNILGGSEACATLRLCTLLQMLATEGFITSVMEPSAAMAHQRLVLPRRECELIKNDLKSKWALWLSWGCLHSSKHKSHISNPVSGGTSVGREGQFCPFCQMGRILQRYPIENVHLYLTSVLARTESLWLLEFVVVCWYWCNCYSKNTAVLVVLLMGD